MSTRQSSPRWATIRTASPTRPTTAARLSLSIKPKRLKSPLATFEGQIRVGQEKAAIAEEITLTFGFTEEVALPVPQPQVAPAEQPVAINPAKSAVNA